MIRGAKAAIRSPKGQQFLREMIEALDDLPEKRLIRHYLEDGRNYCALGAVCRHRGISCAELTDDIEAAKALGEDISLTSVAAVLGVADSLVYEIEMENDNYRRSRLEPRTVEEEARWGHMRKWAESHLE